MLGIREKTYFLFKIDGKQMLQGRIYHDSPWTGNIKVKGSSLILKNIH
jgi:hypothetical protein